MGYGTRAADLGHTIQTFWPDDDENTMYIDTTVYTTMQEIMEKIDEKWAGSSLSNINISAEKIHTDCLGYDLYDDSDYTDFIVIRKTAGA